MGTQWRLAHTRSLPPLIQVFGQSSVALRQAGFEVAGSMGEWVVCQAGRIGNQRGHETVSLVLKEELVD